MVQEGRSVFFREIRWYCVGVIWIGVPFILAFIFIMSVIDDSGDKKQKEEKK